MGYNTPALFLNDAADQIAKDRDLGEKIAQAMRGSYDPWMQRNGRIDLSVGNHANACSVLLPQHGDENRLYHLHGNLMVRGPDSPGARYDSPLSMVEAAAMRLGYKLVKV
jgi:hypothetical protein